MALAAIGLSAPVSAADPFFSPFEAKLEALLEMAPEPGPFEPLPALQRVPAPAPAREPEVVRPTIPERVETVLQGELKQPVPEVGRLEQLKRPQAEVKLERVAKLKRTRVAVEAVKPQPIKAKPKAKAR